MKNLEHGVHSLNTDLDTLSNVRWDDLRAFAMTAQHGSLRAAADAQHVSVNTVRASLARLEEQVNAVLFRRSRSGIQLTESGMELLERVRQMRNAEPRSLAGTADADVLVQPGELRLACSEALGAFWLTPKLHLLAEQLPDLRLNLQLSYDLADDRSRDHDIGLTYHLPADPDLIVSRLATMHVMLFASPDYIAKHGAPTSFDDMRKHRYIEQVTNGANSKLVDNIFGQHQPKGFVPIRSNSAITQFWAAVQGIGIGAFPTYSSIVSDQLVPLDLPMQLRFELYYYYHASAKRSRSVQTALSWLKDAFSPERYPWFADHFVHPRDFSGSSEATAFATVFFNGAQSD